MKTCGFTASATTDKSKQDAQTQVTDAMQAKSVLCMIQLDAIPQRYYVSWEGVKNHFISPVACPLWNLFQ